MTNPYRSQPERAFWKHAVSPRSASALEGLATLPDDLATARIATAGSCFAQHIGRALRARGLNFLDMEPAPGFLTPEQADRYGYNVFSCRTGNVYTTRQLFQLFQEAYGQRAPKDWLWRRDDRVIDALRPGVFADGFADETTARQMREAHLARLRAMFESLDIMVFTLGLTEVWTSRKDGTAYPMAPGVLGGEWDPDRYVFHNLTTAEVRADLEAFRTALHGVNPGARILLTVSPVPLAATATDEHVLTATTFSKAILRAVAGEMANAYDDVFYFPSYELITGQPARHFYYAPDLREVTPEGVAMVMQHFFAGLPEQVAETAAPDDLGYEHCEEGALSEEYDGD